LLFDDAKAWITFDASVSRKYAFDITVQNRSTLSKAKSSDSSCGGGADPW
jgi:hypothetical protein